VPWRESSFMSEKLAFIQACLDRKKRIVEICNEFGISEKTGHKHLQRFRKDGIEGLRERSHAGLTHPHRISPEVTERIVALRRKYPLYGPQMLRDWLIQHDPQIRWPAASSIGDLLKRSGLIVRSRRRSRDRERAALDSGRTRALEPNMVWTADFKGQFRLRNGIGPYCYPLTVMDLHSRFMLGVTALDTTAVIPTQKVFIRLFREFGLPGVIRTDNGEPFARANAIGRLGRLALWWVRLGIRPEHIKPATPSENGAHERFHRTLKAATTKPASDSLQAQQRRFDNFIIEYNSDRPHSSLPEHRPPGQFYTRSPRIYPTKLPALIYPDGWTLRMVTSTGNIKWRNQQIFLSSNLSGDYVGICQRDEGRFIVSYGSLELGYIQADTNQFVAAVKWNG
jgi:putative transposase